MTKTIALISALALAASLGAAGANAAPVHKHHATSGELASKAQLDREHNRAMKAGDTANDPFNSASSDSLNQQQLAKAQALTGPEVQPGAISSGATNTSGADTTNAPAPASSDMNTNTSATTGTSTDTNAMPPATPPSAPQGTMPSTSPSSPQ